MKRVKGSQAFTLIELVFVIAIIVALASIFLPIGFNALQKADEASADASIQQIAAAFTSFYDDLRHFPTCDGADCSPIIGTGNDLVFLAFGTGFGNLSAAGLNEYPAAAIGVGNWGLEANDEAAADADRNNGANHLVQNDPNADATINGVADYATSGSRRWRGPYLSRVGVDPWGRAFIAHVGAMETGGTPVVAGSRGWILSAGPNNSLDTLPNSATLVGDDRGFIFTSQ